MLNIITVLMNRTTEVSSCYIKIRVGLLNWVRKEELERWV